MLSPAVRTLKQLSATLARNFCVIERLDEHLKRSPICFDLNQHLQIRRIVQDVAGDVTALGFACSIEDVMLIWLTRLVPTED
jgi:hypothetical protein